MFAVPCTRSLEKLAQVVNIPEHLLMISLVDFLFFFLVVWYELNTCHTANHPLNGQVS